MVEHFDGFVEAAGAGLFFFRFGDPAAVFLAVGVAELLEDGQEFFFPEERGEVRGDFEGSDFFVRPELDVDRVAGLFAELFADGFRNMQHVLRHSVGDERAGAGHAIEGGLDGNFAFGAEFLLDVVGEENIGATTGGGLDGRSEFVFHHGAYFAGFWAAAQVFRRKRGDE